MNKLIILSLLLAGCPIGGGNNETYMQCYDCYDEDCSDIMYVSPEVINIESGGIK